MDFNTIFHKFSRAISTIGQTILPQAMLKSGHNINAQDIRVDTIPAIASITERYNILHYYKKNDELQHRYAGWYVNTSYNHILKFIPLNETYGYILRPIDAERTTWRVFNINGISTYQTGFIAPTDILTNTGQLSLGYQARICINLANGQFLPNNGKWKFDYYAGLLSIDLDYAKEITASALYFQGFQYIGRTVSTLEAAINEKFANLSSSINFAYETIETINTNVNELQGSLNTLSGSVSQSTANLDAQLSAAIAQAEQQLAGAVNTITGGMLVIQPYKFTSQQLMPVNNQILYENNYQLGLYKVIVPGFCFNVEAQIKQFNAATNINVYSQSETIIVQSEYNNGSTTLYIKLDSIKQDNGIICPRLSINGEIDLDKPTLKYSRVFTANSFEYKTGNGLVKLQVKELN